MNEKKCLILLDSCPYIVKLHSTFKDDENLYLVLEFASGGELFSHIKRLGSCHVSCARWLTAELVNALECMHSKGVIHRDLKPENILLDELGHVKLVDFGSGALGLLLAASACPAALLPPGTDRRLLRKPPLPARASAPRLAKPHPTPSHLSRRTAAKLIGGGDEFEKFVGTAEYVSPEVLTDSEATEASDLWALGCILFQMVSGRPPFRGAASIRPLSLCGLRPRPSAPPPPPAAAAAPMRA